jgi:hypothetical protein
MRASKLCFLTAVLAAIAGMLWGLDMAISENHAAMPAHAHLNLLGWVSLFLFGIFYRLHPSLDATKVALTQVWVWIVGTIVMAVGVGLVSTGTVSAEPIAAIGSLIVLADMLLFAWLVYRGECAAAST